MNCDVHISLTRAQAIRLTDLLLPIAAHDAAVGLLRLAIVKAIDKTPIRKAADDLVPWWPEVYHVLSKADRPMTPLEIFRAVFKMRKVSYATIANTLPRLHDRGFLIRVYRTSNRNSAQYALPPSTAEIGKPLR